VNCGEKSRKSNKDQEPGEEYTGGAEAHVPFHTTDRDERDLSDEQQNPEGEDSSMEVNQPAGKVSVEDSGEIVAARETGEDGGEDERAHGGEEILVGAITRLRARDG